MVNEIPKSILSLRTQLRTITGFWDNSFVKSISGSKLSLISLRLCDDVLSEVPRKYGDTNSRDHSIRVAALAATFSSCNYEIICSAILHDVLEDSSITESDLETALGWYELSKDIIYNVKALTNNLETIKEIGYKNYMVNKLLNVPYNVVLIKFCDFVDNMCYTKSKKFISLRMKVVEEVRDKILNDSSVIYPSGWTSDLEMLYKTMKECEDISNKETYWYNEE